MIGLDELYDLVTFGGTRLDDHQCFGVILHFALPTVD